MTNPNSEPTSEARLDNGITVREELGSHAFKMLTVSFASPEDTRLYLATKREEYINGAFEDYPTMPHHVRPQVAELMGAMFDRSLARGASR